MTVVPEAETLVVCLINCPDAALAKRIGRALVERRLAAAVNLVPGMTSLYRWQGAILERPETLLLAKTRASLIEPINACLRALHPDRVPACLALSIAGIGETYGAWLLRETDPVKSTGD